MKNEYIMVTGAMNWKKADRTLERSQIYPVQIITPEGEIVPVLFFQKWGELGVGSVAWDSEQPLNWFVSTSNKVFHLNLETLKRQELPIKGLSGIHEISLLDGKLWISNTRHDEVISFNTVTEKITDRLPLTVIRHNLSDSQDKTGYDMKIRDKFHCNLVFEDYEGKLCCLVHHTSGLQRTRKIADRIIKQQGNGGIIYIESGVSIDLGLCAPHSARRVDNHYWILDSGTNNLRIYNRQWQLEATVPVDGWGRGADITEDHSSAYIGISATRKRYLGFFKKDCSDNSVLQLNVSSHKVIRKWKISRIEQINDVYVLPENAARKLLLFNRQ